MTKKPTSAKRRTTKIETVVKNAVKSLLPKENFKVKVAKASIGDMQIIRVVTPEWKGIRPALRIEKVLGAVNGKLSVEEQDKILRFSVLTPDEYKTLVQNPAVKLAHSPSKLAKSHKRRVKKAA